MKFNQKFYSKFVLAVWTLLILVAVASAFAGDLPDATATPGAINASITQENMGTTICNKAWSTKSIRPTSNYTTKLKKKQMLSGPYISTLTTSEFEEDHLISLEIGGNPTDEKNLWPQKWASPNGAHEKDALENRLHKLVCNGTLKLTDAQHMIATDWIAAYHKYVKE